VDEIHSERQSLREIFIKQTEEEESRVIKHRAREGQSKRGNKADC
jgi:hypothetical protein